MTWAEELLKKKRNVKYPVLIGGLTSNPDRLMEGYYFSETDLVGAVLEKDKEIEEDLNIAFNKDENYGNWLAKKGLFQARAFRDLVQAFKEVKKK